MTTTAPAGAPDDNGDELGDQLGRRAEHARRSEGGDPWTRAHDDAPEPTSEQVLAAFVHLGGQGTFTTDALRGAYGIAPPSIRPYIHASAEALKDSLEIP